MNITLEKITSQSVYLKFKIDEAFVTYFKLFYIKLYKILILYNFIFR